MMKLLPTLALSAALLSPALARAETPAAPPADAPAMERTMMSAGSYKVSVGELAAIGAGAVVGAALVNAMVGHGLMLAGAAVGGWVGDWWYTAPPHAVVVMK